MRRLLLLYRSLVGKKAVVAVTGAILLAFLALHVAGNLKTFLPGPEPGVADIDVYSAFLRTVGEPLLPPQGALWAIRFVLAVALVLHLVCVFQLALHNRRARPEGYDRVDYTVATASGRWMLYTGSLLLLFIVVHILHFTTGTLDSRDFVHGAVYGNLFRAFGQWHYVAFYLAAMGVLAMHLYHGAWSVFQSLGVDNPDRNRGLRWMAIAIAVVLPLAFASVPVAFFAGAMDRPPVQTHSATGGR